ncbi:MmgE/PrpD family protein [Salipiger sp.]|uniref:MmgE/PrpD family protein n=1 Tax=Salipiger sp. TaxID=2078585 RepID=UPI003A97320F
MTGQSLNEMLSDFAAGLDYATLPEEVRTHARFLILDAMGCGIVGSATDEAAKLHRAVLAMSGGSGNARLWGTDLKAPLPLAVMANSVAVHTREIDDFSLAYHAGSVVVPAAVGVAEVVGASGEELIAAVAAGYEVSFRIAMGGAAPGQPGFLSFKKKGWHSTSLFGPFGAAVAAAKLLGLDAAGLRNAIGIAASSAGGTWAFIDEGNTNKRVHPGLASRCGVAAAFLAREGITGPSRVLEADWGGFYGTFLQGEAWYPEHVIRGLGSEWEILHAGFKPYASCRRIHSSLDALFEAARKHGLAYDDVKAITINGHHLHKRQLSKFPVSTVLEAQFSLPYTLSAALKAGSGGLDLYRPEAMANPEVALLARNVSIEIDPDLPETGEPRLDFALADGRVVSERVEVPKGHPKNPLTPAELMTKLRTNAALYLPPERVAALSAALAGLDQVPDVSALTGLMVSPAVRAGAQANA